MKTSRQAGHKQTGDEAGRYTSRQAEHREYNMNETTCSTPDNMDISNMRVNAFDLFRLLTLSPTPQAAVVASGAVGLMMTVANMPC